MDKELILSRARHTFSLQRDALEYLSEQCGDSFITAVESLAQCDPRGRIVISGMGKAGFIGMKCSATLASLGLPSYFLHPAEGYHGDYGRLTEFDILLVLSNTGETEEILKLASFARDLGCFVIAISRNNGSSLSHVCSLLLPLGSFVEGGSFSIAPTTSTTAMLALCDTLAVCASEVRNFQPEAYAKYHPGGGLGKSLLVVRDIMRTGDFHCICPDTYTTREVLKAYVKTPGRPGAATLTREDGTLSGIFTDGDLRRLLEKGEDFLDVPISKVMSKSPHAIPEELRASEALTILSELQLDNLIVVGKENIPIGMVDIQDLVRVFRNGK